MTEAADLVLRGRIVALTPLPGPRRRGGWRVTMAVDRVVEGEFTGDRFEFAVHSPAKSNLKEGGDYLIRATRTGDGFIVDPLQWLPGR